MRSMPGGARIVTSLTEDLRSALDELDHLDRRTVRTDPAYVERTLDDVRARLLDTLRTVERDLPPLLARNERNRAAAALPDRLAALEEEVRRITERLERAGQDPPT